MDGLIVDGKISVIIKDPLKIVNSKRLRPGFEMILGYYVEIVSVVRVFRMFFDAGGEKKVKQFFMVGGVERLDYFLDYDKTAVCSGSFFLQINKEVTKFFSLLLIADDIYPVFGSNGTLVACESIHSGENKCGA